MRRSAIRADADELTYPVHIMLRYELEKQIFDGTLPVKDLPEAWRTGFERRLGLRPASDTEGCLQDVHWAIGSFGYFPSYALGSFIAAQLYESLRTESEHFDAEIASGPFRRAVRVAAAERARARRQRRRAGTDPDATGKTLSAAPWLRYAEAKYLEQRPEEEAGAVVPPPVATPAVAAP